MKKLLLIVLLSIFSIVAVYAQLKKDPIVWTFKANKKSADTYEVTATATVPKPWHIYSQNTPDGGPVPTKITFKPNPMISLQGKVTEKGKLEKIFDQNFGVNVLFYSNELTLVQTVKVKSKIKTSLSGTIQYMVCDDNECLPPTRKNFDIALQ